MPRVDSCVAISPNTLLLHIMKCLPGPKLLVGFPRVSNIWDFMLFPTLLTFACNSVILYSCTTFEFTQPIPLLKCVTFSK